MLKLLILASCLHAGLALQSFLDHEVVPDVVSTSPTNLLNISFPYPNGVEALEGNLLTIFDVEEMPKLRWNSSTDEIYTLVFCDPDVPSRNNPYARSFLLWLVVNIPGDDISAGETLGSFIFSYPLEGTGVHRYVYLIYRQPSFMQFDESYTYDEESRSGFSADSLAEKYRLGAPLAGNFYQTHNPADVIPSQSSPSLYSAHIQLLLGIGLLQFSLL